jgi:hypothetical protein
MDALAQNKTHYEDTVAKGFANASKYDYVNIAEAYYKIYQELNKSI